MKPVRRKGGLTLLEVVLAVSILVLIGGSIYVATDSLSSAFRTGTSLAALDAQGHDGISEVGTILEKAVPTTLLPPSSAAGTSAIDFQRATGFTDGEVDLGIVERIVLEQSPTDPADGLDNDGNGLVDEGQLVWIELPGQPGQRRHLLLRGVAAAAEDEVAGNGLDDNGNGIVDEPGFSLVYDDRTITIRLTVERTATPGRATQRTFERTVAYLNGGEDEE